VNGRVHTLSINGPDDPRVRHYQSVSDPELARRAGLFVAEGRLVVERLISDGRFSVRSVLVSDAACRALGAVLATLPPSAPVYVSDAAGFRGITGYDVHRGCLALGERPAPVPVDALLRDVRLAIVLDGVTNADNVGGVFRNAAAFRAGAVLRDATSCDPLYRKAIRTSMAATLRVPFARLADTSGEWPAALARLKAAGFALVALTPGDETRDLQEFTSAPPPGRLALIVGSEGEGVSAASAAAADCRLRIPIDPRVDSLNLAVAAGIALYALTRGTMGGREDGPRGSIGQAGHEEKTG
jgi:tRNA G18 (ribose-2'-O)-methylase SpoU